METGNKSQAAPPLPYPKGQSWALGATALDFSSFDVTGKKRNWANWRVILGTLRIWHLCASCDSGRTLYQNQNFFHDNLSFMNVPVITSGDFLLLWWLGALLAQCHDSFCSSGLRRAKSWQVSRELLERGVVVTKSIHRSTNSIPRCVHGSCLGLFWIDRLL